MKFIPILFSTPMVQAILEGRKTMTRRVVKMYATSDSSPIRQNAEWLFNNKTCPYGQPGDVLWVRESWLQHPIPIEGFKYKSDYSDIQLAKIKQTPLRWKPSIHMPKAACRIFLKVVSVRVERLQEISEADAKAEGISIVDNKPVLYNNYLHNIKNAMWPGYGSISKTYGFTNPKDSFHSLWESINGIESWAINPWVWVVEFERIDKPENFL